MRAQYSLAEVDVWAQDEQRVGLQPILRRVWAPRGARPVVRGRPKYAWVWGYGFVRPATGQAEWLLLPRVNRASFEVALAQFARAAGAGPRKRVVLVLARAGWHTTEALTVPAGVHLAFLPAHSPELQPAERLWPLCDEGVANQLFASIAELEAAVARRLVALKDEVVRALPQYHWWPQHA